MLPELKIFLYIFFIAVLFFVRDLSAHICAATAALFLALVFVPVRRIRGGLFLILIFLLFTFAGNLFFHSGRILYGAGFFSITDEGLRFAAIRTLRVFSMVFGAKILTARLSFDEMIHTFENILRPLERIGIPVKDFFSIMGLTLKSFPALLEHLRKTYREDARSNEIRGFRKRTGHMVTFLMPVFVKSIRSPESFFEGEAINEEHGENG